MQNAMPGVTGSLDQLADNRVPHFEPHFPPSHIPSRFGFIRSNVRQRVSIFDSTSSAEASRFSTRKVCALPRYKGTSAWTMWSRLITVLWYAAANSYTVRTQDSFE